MKRILGISVALLAAGCGLRPWTPSVSVAFWAEDVPEGRDVSLPRSTDLARSWQLPSDLTWSRWGKGTLMSAVEPMGDSATLPDVRSLEVVGQADAAAANVARGGLPQDTLWLVDLRGAASCAFAARLSHDAREPVAPVVTFNNWPANESVVPADETLAGLITFSPKLPPEGTKTAHPIFLLDSWRLAFRFDKPADDTYDNRYMLMASDLPDVETLRAQGITRVVYVVEDLDDAEVEEDDLHASFRAWQAAGLGIHMVDLAFLTDVPAPAFGSWRVDWAARLAPQAYWVRERYTLVDDPVFYGRARAGFGLAFGRPFFGPHYRGGGGYGYGGSSRGSSGYGGGSGG
ncbi:MAG: hypothetical protein JWP87_1659 [Labilithrix sp.]|nr:hypothetical protein [Labilithrix sp.]